MTPCPWCACTISGLDSVPRILVVLENDSFLVSLLPGSFAVLINIDWRNVSEVAFWPVSAMVGLPVGNKWVPAGSTPVPCKTTGNSWGGSMPSVRCQSEPPIATKAPPRLIHVCKAVIWSWLRVLVVKSSRTITSKLSRTSATSGIVLAFKVANSTDLPRSGNKTLLKGLNSGLSAVWSESMPMRTEPECNV